ncbi:MAG: PIG-L deacetylase family protein [Steroidobacteraceae bacterium]
MGSRIRMVALLATALLAPAALADAGESCGGLPPIDATTSLLVVAPHPDDETLCCAGVMQRVLAAGGHVSVVWITSGDGSELSMLIVEKSVFAPREKVRDLAARRMQEARAATALLGVQSTQQLFLGYPDGVLKLLTDNRSTAYHAKFTGETRVPYADALFPGHSYTGDSLEHDFEAVLERTRPTLVLAPSPADTHPDHRASGMLAIRILTRRGELSKAHYWIVHGGEGWPSPRGYMPGIPLDMPPSGRGLASTPFCLTDDEEARKLQAVRAYRSQMDVMSPFLLTFVRTSELYFRDSGALEHLQPAAALREPWGGASDPISDPTRRRSAPADGRATRVAASCGD